MTECPWCGKDVGVHRGLDGRPRLANHPRWGRGSEDLCPKSGAIVEVPSP